MNQTINIGPVAHGETITLVCGTAPPGGGTNPPIEPPVNPPTQPPSGAHQIRYSMPAFNDASVKIVPLQVGQELAVDFTTGTKGGWATLVGRMQNSKPGKYQAVLSMTPWDFTPLSPWSQSAGEMDVKFSVAPEPGQGYAQTAQNTPYYINIRALPGDGNEGDDITIRLNWNAPGL